MEIIIKRDIEDIMEIIIQMSIVTDDRSLFNILNNASTTLEELLKIDLEILRDAYQYYEVTYETSIRADHNIAHALTKKGTNLLLWIR